VPDALDGRIVVGLRVKLRDLIEETGEPGSDVGEGKEQRFRNKRRRGQPACDTLVLMAEEYEMKAWELKSAALLGKLGLL
jgi:hypothetical protein